MSAKLVINCAGLHSGKIAEMVGDSDIQIGARKGEYILLDRESGGFISHTLFFTLTKKVWNLQQILRLKKGFYLFIVDNRNVENYRKFPLI